MPAGNVIGECEDRHTAKEYITFLKKLNKRFEKGKVLHIIADNYSTINERGKRIPYVC
jgi:hypothetical protein